jgi:RNA 2',3'-cyclic 3'-phosphodiesterase
MRLFVGIPLGDSTVRELVKLTQRLRSSGFEARWSKPESWHVTLVFLGNASEEQYSCLTEQLGTVRAASFPLRLGELGGFVRVGVLYAEVLPSAQLAALQKRVEAAAQACGFAPGERAFRPHVTLARSRKMKELGDQVRNAVALPGLTATEFVLYESYLSQTGSTYEMRQRFPLDT